MGGLICRFKELLLTRVGFGVSSVPRCRHILLAGRKYLWIRDLLTKTFCLRCFNRGRR
jgi:hypothetical protein